jgi:hypothetical protein
MTPQCDHTNKDNLILRPSEAMTYEQRWAGIWWDCPHCTFSLLEPSPERQGFLAMQRKGTEAEEKTTP